MANFSADGYFLCIGYTNFLPYVTFNFYSMVTQQLQDSVRFEAMFSPVGSPGLRPQYAN